MYVFKFPIVNPINLKNDNNSLPGKARSEPDPPGKPIFLITKISKDATDEKNTFHNPKPFKPYFKRMGISRRWGQTTLQP